MAKPKAPGHIQRRRSSWRVILCVGGKAQAFGARTEPTLKHGTKNDVIEWSWRKYDELKKAAEREEVGLPGRVRMSELLRRYRDDELPTKGTSTARTYEATLKPVEYYFVELHGNPMLDQIHSAHVKAYLSWRRTHGPDGTVIKKPLGARSQDKDRAVLHQLFAFADLLELREGNPVRRVPKIKGDAKEPVLLSVEQYEALLKACEDPIVQLYVLVLGETGARDESEALWLRFEDVNFETGFLTIVSGRGGHRTKSGKSRLVPMTARLVAALKGHFATYRLSGASEWIFFHERTRRRYLRGTRVHSFRGAVANAVERANEALQRMKPKRDPIPEAWVMHDLRHRRVTTWLGDGKSPVHVQHAMGHSDIKTTMHYYQFLAEHLRALVEEPTAVPAQQAGGR
jgi:integrase